MDSEEAFCYPYTQIIEESRIEISYTIRYPELKESENRWAMRQTAVYHCYNTQTRQSVFVLLSPAVDSLAHQRAEQYLTACHSGNLKGPFWLHDIVFSAYLPAWRRYIADLERKFLPISGTTFSTYIDKELRVGYDNLSTLVSLQNRFLQVPAILGHAIDTLKELYVLLDEHPLLRILPFETRQLTIQLRNQYSNCRAYSRTAAYLQQRTQATATLLSDTLSFRDQVVAKEQNGTMLQLNKSAVFITMLTLFYLPASFVACLLSRTTLIAALSIKSSGSLAAHPALTEEVFVDAVKKRRLQRFLAILIFASCPIDALITFTTRLVISDAWLVRKNEEHLVYPLPADLEQLECVFEDDITAYRFYTTQACFCTVVLRHREEVRIEHPERYRLPYLEEQPLAEGSFGKVYKVRVAKGHFINPRGSTPFTVNTAPMDIARKDYVITPEFRVQREREIMETILSSSSRSENILESFGGLEVSPTTYCLFMPLAICDLRAYMMEHHTTPPNTEEAKANYIRCAEGLAGGLSFLHLGIDTPDLDKLVCYHMDLKPDNILLFQEENRWIWKLSDFGMSCVKKRRRVDEHSEAEKNFNRWFVRRRTPGLEPSVDPTRNNRGEGTYLAPESMLRNPRMTASSDVWSLGCVISVLFAYLDDGRDGVLQYQAHRMRHRKADNYDRFFIPNPGFLPNDVHPAIEKEHDKLIKSASSRGYREAKAVEFMLRRLEESVLKIDQERRISAARVKDLLGETFRILKQPEDRSEVQNSIRPRHRGLRNLVGPVLRTFGPGKRDSHTPVPTDDPWRLLPLEWPAVDVTQMSLPVKDDIYMVIQPELTIKSQEHKVRVACLSLQTGLPTILNVEAKDLGTNTMNTVGLFTTFAPFHHHHNRMRCCAIVIREKRLLVANLEDPAHDSQRDILGYRVLSLMASSGRRPPSQSSANEHSNNHNYYSPYSGSSSSIYDHHHRRAITSAATTATTGEPNARLYALAAPNASHRIVLIEVHVPSSRAGAGGEGEVAVRELAHLEGLGHDDVFAVRVCEPDADGEGEGYVLVAALVGANRRAIYRVPLAVPSAGAANGGRGSA
ncbi:hypothetical protein DL766_007079 [Monosporascus sp. MC13-8B]|nr:hypothetical protein DL763_005500 [Monosporascus cannonballus]RYP25360.1 hypothetical protein DL766_007079 [Monosporascus sp. MC13-8B]